MGFLKKAIVLLVLIIFFEIQSDAQVIRANPDDYTTYISTLEPGDTLQLDSGNYLEGLNIHDVHGSTEAPIVIMGSGNSTVFLGDACCNTVSIRTSSFVEISHFQINGQNIDYIDAVKAEGNEGNWAHHITLKNLFIVGHGANQQTNGISTKCPAWDWIIQDCVIDGAGTGMYLGNSNGEEPFVNGLIEHNLIKNTIGYNIQIKHQNVGSRNAMGMKLNGKTIIRHNVFSKENNASSGANARPNLLVGNFPSSGDGSGDYYEIYGNFFWQNPYESLFQGTGNLAFYDNICINHSGGNGIAIMSHQGFQPRDIRIFHNTIINESSWGVRLLDTDLDYQKYIYGNAIFSDHSTPIRIVGNGASTVNLLDNTVDVVARIEDYVNTFSATLTEIDLYPSEGSGLNASPVPNTLFLSYSDFSLDFNGDARSWNFRGAYSGSGRNEGWKLALEKKPRQDDVPTASNEEINKDLGIDVDLYPNPSSENILLSSDMPLQDIALTIIAASGKVVWVDRYPEFQEVKLSVYNWESGMYFIRIRSSKWTKVLPLICDGKR